MMRLTDFMQGDGETEGVMPASPQTLVNRSYRIPMRSQSGTRRVARPTFSWPLDQARGSSSYVANCSTRRDIMRRMGGGTQRLP
jgi:hypothetical protein